MNYANALVVFGFTFIHINSRLFHFDKLNFTARFSSFVGGISIAYVFFHLFPTLIHYQEDISHTLNLPSASAFQLIFGTILLGLVVFYFLEMAMQSAKLNVMIRRIQHKELSDENFEQRHQHIFWAHMASYALYNTIIGILLADQRFETSSTAFFYLIAIGLHFFTNDWVLRHHFTDLYDKYGALIISLTVVFGFVLGQLVHMDHTVIALLEAFVSGGLILNAIKDELPACRGNNFGYFIAGTVLYSFILILM